MTENPKIPKLELEKFIFSPPGPMGWNMAEYEKMLQNLDQLVLNEETVTSQLETLRKHELVELALSGVLHAQLPITENIEINSQEEEEVEVASNVEVENVEGMDYEEIMETEEETVETGEEIIEIEEIVVPKKRVTIIVEEQDLKQPWIAFPTSLNMREK